MGDLKSRPVGEFPDGGRTGRVIVSADDFGITAGVNRGIVEALERGDVTSTAIILGQPGTAEALEWAATVPQFDFGLHVNLTDGISVSGDRRLAPVIDASGAFLGRRRLAMAAACGALDLEGVRVEVMAQIDVCRHQGLCLTHIDSHHYIHALPGIGAVIRRCAAAVGIPLIRASHWRSLTLPVASAATGGVVRLDAGASGPRDPRRRSPDPRGATDFVVPLGSPLPAPVPASVLRRLIAAVGSGTVEIVSHPGYVDAELAMRSRYVQGRERELELLASGLVRDAIDGADVRLSTFREVATL